MTTPPSPLTFRDYRLYWISRFSAVLAQNAMVIVLGWQVYDSARSSYGMSVKEASFQLGLIGLVQFVPLMMLTPVTGWVADRIDRRLIARLALGLDLFNALALAWATAHGLITLPLLFLIAGLHGVVRAFIGPSLSALGANLVPKETLPRAIAMSSIAWQSASIAGPALAGFLYVAHPALPYWMSAAMLLLAALMLSLIKPVPQPKIAGVAHPLRQMADGFAYVRRHHMLLGCISLDLFAVLLGGATALIPAYARDILHVGAQGFGLMRAAPAAGAALMAVLISVRPIKHNVGMKMLAAVVIFGLMTAGFGVSRSLPLSLSLLFVLGCADMVSVFIRGTLIQLHTPNDMRGRVSSISGLFISASNELGEAESGLLAALIGPMIAVVGGGLAAVGITLLWARLFPELRAAKTFDPPDLETLK